VAVVGSHVRLETRFNDYEKNANDRIKRVEQRTGIAPANGVRCEFVTMSACATAHEQSEAMTLALKQEVIRGQDEIKSQLSEVRSVLMARSHPEPG
jgi:dipeptidase